MKKYCLSFLLFLPFILCAEGSGGFSGAFLRIGLGARAMAMGNAQVASADNGYGIYYNPAGLPHLEKRQFALSYSSMSLDRNFNYIGLASPLPPFAGAAIGWINSGVGNLRAYNSVGEDVGAINHGLNAIYAAFAVNIVQLAQLDGSMTNVRQDLLTVGLAVKFLRGNISDDADFDYKGDGFGFDFGLMLRPHERLSLGYQLKDINAGLKSNTNDLFDRGTEVANTFPRSQKLGAFYHTPLQGLAVAYDFEWNDKGTEKHHFGVEYVTAVAIARAGYDDSRLTLGGGLQFQAYKRIHMILDYAFIDSVIDEGLSHVFSWRFLF